MKPNDILWELREGYHEGFFRLHFGPYRRLLGFAVLYLLFCVGLLSSWTFGAALFVAAGWNAVGYRFLLDVGQPPKERKTEGGAPLGRGDEEADPYPGVDDPSATVIRVDTVVIGAGAAGLAAGACLRRRSVPCVVLEGGTEIGAQWKTRYSRLHLHTDKEGSGLPYVPFPDHVPMYPGKDDVADYLRAYHALMRVPVLFQRRATRISRIANGGGGGGGGGGAFRWAVETANEQRFECRHVVVAIGESTVPVVPPFSGIEDFSGRWLHSCDYRSGAEFRGKRVLVVGFGNSGCEIWLDLYEQGAKSVDAVVRSEQYIVPRDTVPGWVNLPAAGLGTLLNLLPTKLQDAAGRLTMLDYSAHGVRKSRENMSDQLAKHRSPLMDIGMMDLVRTGRVGIRPGLTRFSRDGTTVEFDDGSRGKYDVVIFATGYECGLERLLEPSVASEVLSSRHFPLTHGRDAGNGIFFNGYVDHFGKIREMSLQATRVARTIAADFRKSH